jgi:Methylamine utilisation protein MauE
MNSASTAGVMAQLAAQLAAFLSLLLLASGLHKLLGRGRAQSVMREFAGLPRTLAPIAVISVAAAEGIAGVMLLTPAYRAQGGAVAALIWAAYLGLIVRAMAQGRRDVDCGCTFGTAHRPLGAFQVTRNAALVGMGALVATGGTTAVGVPAGTGLTAGSVIASRILAALTLAALYGALEQVMALRPPRGGVLL